jgi:hypothetical protein
MDPCPLDTNNEDKRERYNPSSPESALCFQLHDTLRIAYGNAGMGNIEGFEHTLGMIEAHIHSYRVMHAGRAKTKDK